MDFAYSELSGFALLSAITIPQKKQQKKPAKKREKESLCHQVYCGAGVKVFAILFYTFENQL